MKHLSCILLAALTGVSALAFAQAAAPDKVAQVANGELKEARASWWGFNAEDSTNALVKALNSKVPKLIIDKMPSPWITAKTLSIPSNIEIVFEEGAVLEAKRGCFLGKTEALIQIMNVSDITLRGLGKGATLLMHKTDYHAAPYEKSEWRHTISLLSCSNVNILNLTLKDWGGDGIYYGVRQKDVWPTNIVVRDVICDGHNRQGISVIAAVNCLVENCKLINTWGTPPAAGIDFEPNHPGQPIRGFVMRNCESYNNQGCGYEFALHNMDASSGPLEITLENCTSRNEGRSAFLFVTYNGPGYNRPGLIHVKNCVFEDNPQSIILSGTSSEGFETRFENVTIKNIASKDTSKSPFEVSGRTRCESPFGNIHFINTNVYDTVDRPVFKYIPGGSIGGLDNVSGTITGYLNGKKTQEMTLTNEWAHKNYPSRKLHHVKHTDITNMSFEPVTPGMLPADSLSPIFVRNSCRWSLLATKGDMLKLTLGIKQFSTKKGSDSKAILISPSGKRLELGLVPFKEEATFTKTNLPESGLYTLEMTTKPNLGYVKRCNLPIAIRQSPSSQNLCYGTGYAYFYVPENTSEFVAQFSGEGAEGLKVTIWGPDGTQLWQKDDISMIEQFVCTGDLARKGGIFKFLIEKPTHLATLEDYYIRFDGIPSLIGLAPELMMKPAK